VGEILEQETGLPAQTAEFLVLSQQYLHPVIKKC
jgi:hypothetical protein